MIVALLGMFNPDISFYYTDNLIWWCVLPLLWFMQNPYAC